MRKHKVYVSKYTALVFIEDERLPDDVIELRHPKTGKLIGRVINIGSMEE